MTVTKKEILRTLAIQVFLIVLFGHIYASMDKFLENKHFAYNDDYNAGQEDKTIGFFDYLYFSAVTSASTGFGDVIPASDLARVIVTIQILLSYSLILRLIFTK